MFSTDKAILWDVARDGLDTIGLFLQQNPSATVLIEGYADDSKLPPTRNEQDVRNYLVNLELSKNRAEKVRDYLAGNFAVAGNRVSVRWYGSTRTAPADPSIPRGAENRRVVVTVNCR